MRKKMIYCLVTALVLFSTILTTSKGAVQVEINDAFDFDVLKSLRSITIGSNTADASGYEIDGQHFDQGTTVNLNVTGFGIFDMVNYNISKDGYSEIRNINSLGFIFSIIFSLYQPFEMINDYSNVSEWDQATADEDPGILIYPFLSNSSSTWDFLANYAEDAINGTLLDSYDGTEEVETFGSLTNTTDFFMMELYYEGLYHHNVTDGAEIILAHSNVKHNFKIAYNKTIGVMLGIRVRGTLSGVANETQIFIQYDQHTELAGYNLPDFEFGVVTPTPTTTPSGGNPFGGNKGLIIGLSVAGGVVVIVIIVTTVLLVRKKNRAE